MRFIKKYNEEVKWLDCLEGSYVIKYMDYKPFFYEDHEDICDFFGQELENATGLKYGYERDFIVKLYNLDRGSELVQDGSGMVDFATNTYLFTILVRIGNSESFYIVRRFVFDLNGDLIHLNVSNARGLKEIQLSKISKLDYGKIKKFLSQPHYVNFIEDANEEEVNKSEIRFKKYNDSFCSLFASTGNN